MAALWHRLRNLDCPLQRTFLRDWREHRELTQEQAAEKLNISRALLSKIENAKSPYTQGLLEQAAEVYQCSVADLVAHSPAAPAFSIVEKIHALRKDQQQHVVEIVKTFDRAS